MWPPSKDGYARFSHFLALKAFNSSNFSIDSETKNACHCCRETTNENEKFSKTKTGISNSYFIVYII